MVDPIAKGERTYGPSDIDGGLVWYLYRKADLPPDLDDYMLADMGFYEYYGGVGRFFREEPMIRISRTYVLIRQRWGYDC